MLKRSAGIEFSERVGSLSKLLLNEQECTVEAAVIYIQIKLRNLNFIGTDHCTPQIWLDLNTSFKRSW